ncbi:MAG TPA: 4Fe-4S dicluster domain-containing protein [Mariprofundaceae bacterium]|nr:4Fe-4S dicluster domain-containing protein [Mariprofundaceae bacterium]
MAAQVLQKRDMDALFGVLQARGFRTLAPTVQDGTAMWREVADSAELPWGWRDEQAPGHYRLHQGDAGRCFDLVHGPQSLKNQTFVAEEPLMRVKRVDGELTFESCVPEPVPTALIGVRACDLAALGIQDRVFAEGEHADARFRSRRSSLLLVAVHCTRAQPTCFCASMQTGPEAKGGYDLALTELDDRFLIQVGSNQGASILSELPTESADCRTQERARRAVEACAESQTRGIDRSNLPGALYETDNHPRWQQVAERCLSCANCTMVCPTCFCHRVEETPSLDGEASERTRLWDSCFSSEHSYIHGKNMRPDTKHRYRLWLTHKLASWIDQFGTSGCVGCGRCITWCPVGIDITEEAAALMEKP